MNEHLYTGTRAEQLVKLTKSVNYYFELEDANSSKKITKKDILHQVATKFGYTDINSVRNNIGKIKREVINVANSFNDKIDLYAKNRHTSSTYHIINEFGDCSIEFMVMASHKYFTSGDGYDEPKIYDFAITDKSVKILSVVYRECTINLSKSFRHEIEKIIVKDLILDIYKDFSI